MCIEVILVSIGCASRTTHGHIGAFIMQRLVWENIERLVWENIERLVWENIERLVWENIERSCGSEILILSSYYTHFQNKLGHYI